MSGYEILLALKDTQKHESIALGYIYGNANSQSMASNIFAVWRKEEVGVTAVWFSCLVALI